MRLLGIVDFFVVVVVDGEIEVGLGGMDDASFDTGCGCLDEVVPGCICFWVDGLTVNTWEHLRTPHLLFYIYPIESINKNNYKVMSK